MSKRRGTYYEEVGEFPSKKITEKLNRIREFTPSTGHFFMTTINDPCKEIAKLYHGEVGTRPQS